MWESILKFLESTGFYALTQSKVMLFGFLPGELVMLAISCVLLYLGIAKKFEPLLLVPIAFGMLLANIPWSGIVHMELFQGKNIDYLAVFQKGGLLDILYLGVKLGIYPPLIFLGVGAMTDFGPLIANPSSLLMGAAAQLGIFVAFLGARALDIWVGPLFGWTLGFDLQAAASIGIIGGADGPTAIFLTSKLKPDLLPAVAIAAYSYMALIPVIQPPIMRALTTKKERMTVMGQLREVSKKEKIIFPIIVTILVGLLLPDALPLIGALMLGNLFRESGVTQRLSDTAQNALINILTIFLGVSVGATAGAERFLAPQTLMVIAMGLVAFCIGTAGGVLLGKVMYYVTGGKVNPLIGSAGVSAVPMAARVSQVEGQKANPGNYLLMHAMGPNVAGVIGSAVAAGVLLVTLGK